MKAIIYIPGLGTRLFDQSVESFAYRFKKALDINDINPARKFEVEVKKINFGEGAKQEASVASVIDITEGGRDIAYEFYELNYGKNLTDKYEERNIVIKILLLFTAIIVKFPSLIFQFAKTILTIGKHSTLTLKDVLQFTYAAVLLMLISIFGILLLASVASYLPDLLTANNIALPVSVQHYLIWFRDLINAKYVILISTLLMLFMPNAKNFISIIATEYVCTIYYLNFGDRRQGIIGKLEELAEHVHETAKPDDLSIYSYSFGSIIALDALFPQEGKPSRRLSEIHTLVTIGSPVDFINAYWPGYFKLREKSSACLSKWYNIYSISDILSSNFRYDDKLKDAQYSICREGILPVNIPYNIVNIQRNFLLAMLFLGGLRAHQLYWDEELYSSSCLTNLVLKMKDDEMLK